MLLKTPVFLLAVLVLGGAFSFAVSYYAVGASFSGFILVLYLIAFLVTLCSLRVVRIRTFSLIIASTLLIFTLPFQISNLWRLYFFSTEAGNLVKSLESLRKENKPLPDSMQSLPIENPTFRPQVQNYQVETNGFFLCYFVSDPGTSYCYTSEGGWTYTDD